MHGSGGIEVEKRRAGGGGDVLLLPKVGTDAKQEQSERRLDSVSVSVHRPFASLFLSITMSAPSSDGIGIANLPNQVCLTHHRLLQRRSKTFLFSDTKLSPSGGVILPSWSSVRH
jgi:hypothetical protein